MANAPKGGYAKPPRSRQFQKGRSGNPKGRPKKKVPPPVSLAELPTDAIFREQLYSTVTVRTADGTTKVPFAEAVVRSMMSEAMKGRRLFTKELLAFMREQEQLAEARANATSEKLEVIKLHHQRILDQAAAEGKSQPKVYPHPDDIVRDPTTYRYILIGPFDPDDTPFYDHWIRLQRMLVIWSVMLEDRGSEQSHQESLHMLAFAQIINMQLPPSYRWLEFDWIHARMHYMSMPLKALQRAISDLIEGIRSVGTANLKHALPDQNITILNRIAMLISGAIESASAKMGAVPSPHRT